MRLSMPLKLYWIATLCTLWCSQHTYIAHGSVLSAISSFRRPAVNQSSANLFIEAVDTIERLYVDKSKLMGAPWRETKARLSQYANKMEAIAELLSSIQDPYARILPRETFVSEKQKYQGLKVGLGVKIKRGLSFKYLTHGLRALFIPGKNHLPDSQANGEGSAALPTSKSQRGTEALFEFLRTAFREARDILPNYFAVGAITVIPRLPDRLRSSRLIQCIAASYLVYKLSPYFFPACITSINENSSPVPCRMSVGDVILRANDRNIPPFTAKGIEAWLDRGEVDDEVSLLIISKSSSINSHLHSVSLRRQFQKVSNELLTNVFRLNNTSGVGYVKVNDFTAATFYQVSEAMVKIEHDLKTKFNVSSDGLYLDLRGNPGGSLTAALHLASLFVPYNKVLSQLHVEGRTQIIRNTIYLPFVDQESIVHRLNPVLAVQHLYRRMRPNSSYQNLFFQCKKSLVILVNEATASASEIFIEAVAHNNPQSVITVGRRTVGKNKAQALIRLSDGTGVCFSVCEFLKPNGSSLQNGHHPHVELQDINSLNAVSVAKTLTSRLNKRSCLKYSRQ